MTHEGSFSRSDCHDNSELVNVHFPDPVKLESELVYTLRVKLVAPSYTMGSDGEVNISGPAGINFTLHSTGLGPSDPTSGPVAKFIYSSISSPPQNVVQLSVHMASLLLGLTVSFLERVMGMGMNDGAISVLSSSFLLSHLLPNTLAHLGPIAILQPKSSVAVLDLIQNSLPIVSAAVKELKKKKHVSQEYIDERLIHYASVETDHPYKPASVSHFRVKFPDRVKWMSLEFDPKCGFAQREDKLADLMIPRQQTSPSSDSDDTSNVIVSPMIDVSFDDVYADYEHFGLSTPAGLVLLPGNEVHIIVNTDTEYEKRDKNNHYGIKCQLIGYEWSNDTSQCLMMLEKELVTLGAVCAGSLLSDDLNLPYCG
jgi:E3 ubiquitin-protein ligase MYCBP2